MRGPDADVAAYLASLPEPTLAVLQEVRRTLHDALPGAGEKRSYGIIALTVEGKNVVWLGGFADHVSVYPVPGGDAAFETAVAPYRAGKSTLQFALTDPVPHELVRRIALLLAAARGSRQV